MLVFVAGLFVGVLIGVFVMALMTGASDANDRSEAILKQMEGED